MIKILISLVLLMTFSSVAAKEVMLDVYPTFRITQDENGSQKEQLSNKDIKASRILIAKDSDGNYYWVTRNNTRMFKSVSGIFVTYTATTGAGFVKIFKSNDKNKPSKYIEYVTLGMMSITYYGKF